MAKAGTGRTAGPGGSTTRFWAGLGAATLWRVVVAGRLDLVFDEGYYHYWSLDPLLSYYDHPPLTAWAMALTGWFMGESVWSVRCWPLAGGVALALAGRELARRAYGRRAGDRAGLFLALAPVFLGNGFLMTPDALLVPAWAAALLFTWNALSDPGRVSGWWLAAGVMVGVGLLAKYTMILYFSGLGLLWLLSPCRRRVLLLGGTLAGLVALVLFTPVLYWNFLHDWEPFLFQIRHGFQGKGVSPVATMGDYLGGLLLLVTPLLGGAALWLGFRGLGSGEYRERFFAVFSASVVLFFGFSSMNAYVQANWPMIAFVPGLVLLAGKWEALGRRFRRWALGLLLAVDGVGGAYLLLPAGLGLSVGGYALDPPSFREVVNGPELGREVLKRFEESGADLVAVTSHQLFGRISFYAPELRDRLWLLTDVARLRFPLIEDRRWAGARALIVAHKKLDDPGRGRFESVHSLESLSFPFKGSLKTEVHFALGEGYRP